MSDAPPGPAALESLRKEAKRWLAAIRAGDAEALARLARAIGGQESREPVLRDVQHALARERGYDGWAALRAAAGSGPTTLALAEYEHKARALLDAYTLGTPEAMERHWALTWHRRAWPAMRTYVQLDLGKRPAHDGDAVPLTIEDARTHVAMEHGFRDWNELRATVSAWRPGAPMAASPVRVRRNADDEDGPVVTTRDWDEALATLAAHPGSVLDANGQATDAVLERLAAIEHIETLSLGGSKAVSDAGIAHLSRLPRLRTLDISGTGVTDAGLRVLGDLPLLDDLSLVMTRVTDAGVAHVARCRALRRLNLLWTATGDGAIRALAGLEHFERLTSGSHVTDAGLAALHGVASFVRSLAAPGDGEPGSHGVELRGPFTDRGMEQLRGLDGLHVLALNDCGVTARGMVPLAALGNLARLSCEPDDAWMPHIAALPALRELGAQDTVAGDVGFTALSASRTIQGIWGRRCHNLGTRGFMALSTMPALRKLAVSCLNVDDAGVATLPEFPALRELMPMDVPDAGYVHIGKCAGLETLTLMYCRDTTDAATERITGLRRLRTYFNSYTTITDRTPELLSTIDSLEHVTLAACNHVTDAGVAALARLPHLRKVDVSGTSLTPAVRSAFPKGVIVRYAP